MTSDCNYDGTWHYEKLCFISTKKIKKHNQQINSANWRALRIVERIYAKILGYELIKLDHPDAPSVVE